MTPSELTSYVGTFTIDFPLKSLGTFELFTVVPQGFDGVVVVVRAKVTGPTGQPQWAEAGLAVSTAALAPIDQTAAGSGIRDILKAFAADLMQGSLLVGGVRPWPSVDLVSL